MKKIKNKSSKGGGEENRSSVNRESVDEMLLSPKYDEIHEGHTVRREGSFQPYMAQLKVENYTRETSRGLKLAHYEFDCTKYINKGLCHEVFTSSNDQIEFYVDICLAEANQRNIVGVALKSLPKD